MRQEGYEVRALCWSARCDPVRGVKAGVVGRAQACLTDPALAAQISVAGLQLPSRQDEHNSTCLTGGLVMIKLGDTQQFWLSVSAQYMGAPVHKNNTKVKRGDTLKE